MKKWIYVIFSAAFVLSMTACSNRGAAESSLSQSTAEDISSLAATSEESNTGIPESSAVSEKTAGNGENILIAYFSMPEDIDTEGIDANAGASVVVKEGEVLGNVQYIAQIIQENVGADLFRIETDQ